MPLSIIRSATAAALGAVLLAAQNGAVRAQHPPPHVLADLGDSLPVLATCPDGKPPCGKGPTAACCTDKEWCSEFFGSHGRPVCYPLSPGVYSDESATAAVVAVDAGAKPSGEYSGSADMLGITFKSTVRVDSAAKADMTIAASGLLSFNIDCPGESFSVASGGSVHVGTGGDCLHRGLSKQGITLKSVKYNGGADKLTVVANKLGLDITLVLVKTHVANAEGSQWRYFRGTPKPSYGASMACGAVPRAKSNQGRCDAMPNCAWCDSVVITDGCFDLDYAKTLNPNIANCDKVQR